MSNQPVLAIEGGPKAVTVPVDDSWSKISSLEKDHVNAALDNFDSAYGELDKFEEEFRQMVGTRYALAMCNGTATIHSAVFASGAREGKEVIVPSVTWHASISPILHCGATPVMLTPVHIVQIPRTSNLASLPKPVQLLLPTPMVIPLTWTLSWRS